MADGQRVKVRPVKRLRIADCGLRIKIQFLIEDFHQGQSFMDANEIKRRTRGFALEIIRLVDKLASSKTADIIGRQLIRCGTSVGANYRAACRAKSSADFIHKMGIVEEESGEVIYWLELLADAGLIRREDHTRLFDEANQILSIVVASIRTARANKDGASHSIPQSMSSK